MAGANNTNNFPANGSSGNTRKYNLNGGGYDSSHTNTGTPQHLFYLLWSHIGIIIGSVLACLLIAGFVAYLKTPIYQSNGSIMITESRNQYSYAGSDLGNLLTNSYGIGLGSSIIDELQVLRSRRLSEEIADTLIQQRVMHNGLQYPVLFFEYPGDSTLASTQIVAYRLRENLSFTEIDRESNLINIFYESPSPYEAAKVVNLTIELYSELSTRQNRKSANAAVAFLEKERDRIQTQLNRVELQLQQYMDDNELVQVDAQTQSLINRATELEQQRQQARTRLVAVNSAMEQYQNQLDQIKPGLADQYADALGPNMQRLQYQLAELKTERMQMFSENPQLRSINNPPSRLVELNRQINDYQEEIRSLTGKLLSQSDQYLGFLGGQGSSVTQNIAELNRKIIELKVEQQQYDSQVEVLNQEIANLNETFDNLPENMIGLARLKRNVKINEQLYLTVSEQYAEMSLWQQTQFGKGQLVDDAYIPGVPVEPNVQLYLLIGFLLGGILGMGYIFVKESFNSTIDGVQKLKRFEVPMLAVIPDMQQHVKNEYNGRDATDVQGQQVSTHMVSLLNTISPITESFRRLESNIMHSNPDTDFRSIMITSTTKGEGKTTAAANLAAIMAEADKKIIVVDTDLRRPNLHTMFGLERVPGIVDVLFENDTLEETIRSTVIPNLHVLCAGKRPPNPSAITKSNRFLELIQRLEEQYDHVVLDTSPFGIITDSSSFINQTDGVVVITRFGQTHTGELEHTLDYLERVGARVLGTVLNGFDAGKSSDYYYYGNNYYKEFYGDYSVYNKSEGR